MHESFEDELKNRLQNYSEDPVDGLWTNIASKITSKVRDPFWIVWSNRGGQALTGIIFLASLYDLNFNTNLAASFSQSVTQNRNDNRLIQDDKRIASSPDIGDDKNATSVKENNNRTANEIEEHAKTQAVLSDQLRQSFDMRHFSDSGKNKSEQISRVRGDDVKLRDANGGHTILTDGENSEKDSLIDEKHANLIGDAPRDQDANASSLHEGFVQQDESVDARNTEMFLSRDNKSTLGDVKNEGDSLKFIHDGKDIRKENKIASAEIPAGKIKSRHKVSLYFLAMPTFGYQRIVANRNDNVIIDNIKKVSAFSYKRLGIRAELGITYPLSSRFNITGGILYYQRKQTINYVEKVLDNSNVTSADDQQVNLDPHFVYLNKSFEYELKNMGVQLGANVVLSKNKFLHTAGGGIEFQKGLNKLGTDQKNLSGNPSTFVFYNVYYRMQYPAEGRLRAIFQPTFNYSLYLNQDMNAPFYVKPYGFGLNFGIAYNF
jgi:hypothetical protein